ncbi:MAG: exodeoxyribonuclease VII large subunit [Chloroflexota bacterium]
MTDAEIKSVSRLTAELKYFLEQEFNSVIVSGEISNFKTHTSGHRYFTLKDEGAQIQCIMWRSRILRFEPMDGQKVVVEGAITLYPARGNYQIDVRNIRKAGIGDLWQAFEELKRKLETLGWFSEERKRAIRGLPLRVGVVTSPTGAALRDILTTFNRRMPACEIYFRPALVQGGEAAADIAQAIRELNKKNLDAIIVGRGGGSIEDLWCFNTETVAEAIYKSGIPIVSAVGHETDFTIADFVADLRAPTPTAAAELLTPVSRPDLVAYLTKAPLTLRANLLKYIYNLKREIDRTASRTAGSRLVDRLYNIHQSLDDKERMLRQSVRHKFSLTASSLKSAEELLSALNPRAPLNRGYALLKSGDSYVKANQSLSDFDSVTIERAAETADVKVLNVQKNYRINQSK